MTYVLTTIIDVSRALIATESLKRKRDIRKAALADTRNAHRQGAELLVSIASAFK
jgi:hypothetical protein